MSTLDRWSASPGWPVRAAEAIVFTGYRWYYWVTDVLPVLVEYRTKQWVRDSVDRIPFLYEFERQRIREWLRSHGW